MGKRKRPILKVATGAVPSQTQCRQCGIALVWVRNARGTFVPVSVEDQQRGYCIPHWQRCAAKGET